MNLQKLHKEAREYLRADFVQNKGLKINGTFYQDLESFRNGDKTAYKEIIDILSEGDRIDYDIRVHSERVQLK